MTVPRVRFTFWKAVFLVIMVAGIYCTFVRFFRGLGASTNLSDQFPWGIWIGFDVMCGVMLAAGGFTLTAAVEIFNIKRFHSIIRPTILTAFLGYLLVWAALMYDLGLPWNIWHPLVMRNPHSVMFEVAYCVMLYTTVLALEFSPIVLEHFNLQRPLKIVRSFMVVFVILGVLLSTLAPVVAGHAVSHHAEQAASLLVQPAVAGLLLPVGDCGWPGDDHLRIVDELEVFRPRDRAAHPARSGTRAGGGACALRHPEIRRLVPSRRSASGLRSGYEQHFFLLEMFLSVLAPLGLLLVPKIRESAQGLYLAAVLTLLGFVTNRLNVAITGVENAVGARYTPKWTEVVITAMFVALGFAIFGFVAKYLPIFPEEKAHIPALREPEAVVSEFAVPAHAGD